MADFDKHKIVSNRSAWLRQRRKRVAESGTPETQGPESGSLRPSVVNGARPGIHAQQEETYSGGLTPTEKLKLGTIRAYEDFFRRQK